MEATNVVGTLAMIRRSLEDVAARDEIMLFLEQMVTERDELLRRQEHLTSLARLVEKTVTDADELAAQIKREAEGEAQARVREMLEEAEKRAQQILDEARAKAAADTESEVRAIRASAEKELEEQAARWQAHVKEAAERLYQQMLAQADEAKRQLEAFQTDLVQLVSSVRPTSAEGVPTATPAADEPKGRKLAPEAADEPKERKPKAEPPASPEARAEAPEPGRAGRMDKAEELVDIVILPPRDKQAMDSIRKYLEQQEEVAAVNVEHMTDRTLIQVRLRRSMNVAERLSGLAEVEHLQTVTEGAKTKIQVVLSVKAEIERERDRLDSRANRIASKIGRSAD